MLGTALGIVAGSVLRIRRPVVEHAMTQAGIAAPSVVAKAMYRRLGSGVMDLLHAAGAEADDGRVVIDAAAVSALDRALADGPVILFASHTGNWELAAAAAGRLLRDRGRRLAVIAKPMSVRGVDRFVTRMRARLGVGTIAPRGAFAAARRELRAGGVIVMPIDQVPERHAHALAVPFLGAPAFADRAPATLAWRAKATALVVAAEHGPAGDRVRLLEVIPRPPADAQAQAWIRETTQRATASLEAFVRRSPATWLWLHRRWREPRSPRLVPGAQSG